MIGLFNSLTNEPSAPPTVGPTSSVRRRRRRRRAPSDTEAPTEAPTENTTRRRRRRSDQRRRRSKSPQPHQLAMRTLTHCLLLIFLHTQLLMSMASPLLVILIRILTHHTPASNPRFCQQLRLQQLQLWLQVRQLHMQLHMHRQRHLHMQIRKNRGFNRGSNRRAYRFV